MRVNNNTDIRLQTAADTAGMSRREKAAARAASGGGKKGFFAGNIGSTGQGDYAERIEKRRKQAQKEIKKIIGDAWEGDKKIDADIAQLRSKAAELKSENRELEETIKNSEAEREALKAEYGIEDGSEEQKELELLQRAQDPIANLSKEEWDKYSEITARGLTDYQQRSLEKYKYETECREKLQNNKLEIEGNLGTVRATKQARLEKDPMLEAQGAAEAVAEAASKDIIGMLKQEATEHIDEEYEKNLEAAKKKAEKKEEEEKLKAERDEKKEQLEKHIKELTEKLASGSVSEDAQKEIQEMLDRLKLLDEDIKGSAVDANV
ncbi:MAG: hypothetical protein NC223_09740 [Butyrivibrio sp.]|nr:hypothetical protein [Butyrivibrio sp.]